jgi:hypothetical protein
MRSLIVLMARRKVSGNANRGYWKKMIPVSEVGVWRAAAQRLKLFDIDASTEAALRSDAALDEGSMENHRLRIAVMHAVNELQRPKRFGGEGLN